MRDNKGRKQRKKVTGFYTEVNPFFFRDMLCGMFKLVISSWIHRNDAIVIVNNTNSVSKHETFMK